MGTDSVKFVGYRYACYKHIKYSTEYQELITEQIMHIRIQIRDIPFST